MTKHETFTEIYERYATLIKKSVVTRTNDEELAEDICQQTFTAYYCSMDTVRTDMVKYWLLRVAENLLIDYWRKAGAKKEILEVEADGAYYLAAASVDVEKQNINKMFLCEILEDLRKVNKNWSEALEYVAVMGLSQKETAKLLGVSATVLRARLSRAKRYIRKKYGKDYY